MSLDLSSITDALLDLVSSQWTAAPIWSELGAGGFASPAPAPNFTGLAPDQAVGQSGPQLGLYLYHIETNHAAEALFWQPPLLDPSLPGQPVSFLSMALDAYYLLYAYSDGNWIEEQQLMSVALRVFHTQPVVRSPTGVTPPWELTLTPEHRSYDELSRLWQATTAPLRMSLVYRAAVVLLDPDQLTASTNLVSQVDTSVTVFPPPPANPPTLTFTVRQLTVVEPGGTSTTTTLSPASAAEGQTLVVTGTGIDAPGFSGVYVTDSAGNETDVTSWVVGATTPSSLTLQLPATGSAVTPAVPPPGIYRLSLGSGPPGAAGSLRSLGLELAIAPWVDPTPGPTLPAGTTQTVTGAGLVPGETTVLVGTTALATSTTTSPGPGEVYVDPTGTSLVVNPPTQAPGTVQPLVVQVNQVPADPALWVQS